MTVLSAVPPAQAIWIILIYWNLSKNKPYIHVTLETRCLKMQKLHVFILKIFIMKYDTQFYFRYYDNILLTVNSKIFQTFSFLNHPEKASFICSPKKHLLNNAPPSGLHGLAKYRLQRAAFRYPEIIHQGTFFKTAELTYFIHIIHFFAYAPSDINRTFQKRNLLFLFS